MKTKHRKKAKSTRSGPVAGSERSKDQDGRLDDEHRDVEKAGGAPPGTQNAVIDTDSSGSKGDSGDQGVELEKLRSQVVRLEDQLLRAQAEQQNIRKRAANELAEAVRFANASLIKSLLGTIDDFERTLDESTSADAGTLLQGVRLIYDNFMKVLREHRIEVIEAVDKPFDPRYHEAVQQLPAEGREPGTVIGVLQQGFKLDDRVLRPTRVTVAAASEDEVCGNEADAAGAAAEER